MDHRAGQYLHGSLALLLIPAASGHAYEHLSAALQGLVYVPVVAAARLLRYEKGPGGFQLVIDLIHILQ